MDLPTYTNIWRIEKRLYKLYDFRLPMPLPIGQVTVFAAIAVPYVLLLTLLGLPFNHKLIWLYLLPPGALTWLATRPVLESKRLPELVGSQLRYLAEPRVWCRMAPLAERDVVFVTGRVWRSARVERRQPKVAVAEAEPAALPVSGEPEVHRLWPTSADLQRSGRRPAPSRPGAGRTPLGRPGLRQRAIGQAASGKAASGQGVSAKAASGKAASGGHGPERAGSDPSSGRGPGRPAGRFARLTAGRGGDFWDDVDDAAQVSAPRPADSQDDGEPWPASHRPGLSSTWPQRRAAAPPWSAGEPAVAHPAGPAAKPADSAAWPAGPPARPARQDRDVTGSPPPPRPADPVDEPQEPADPGTPSTPGTPGPRKPVVTVVGADRGLAAPPAVESVLAGPAGQRADAAAGRVLVVPGGHRPGKPGQLQRDRARAQHALAGPCRIVVLGCTVGAGQTITALMVGEVLASLRGEPVAALDLNPGAGSLAARARSRPALSQAASLGQSRLDILDHDQLPGAGQADGAASDAAGAFESDPGGPGFSEPADGARVFGRVPDRYQIVIADPSTSAVPRLLAAADQLVLVAPASSAAAGAITMTFEWLDAHGKGNLASTAILVMNGVSRRTMPHVEQAERGAVGRCHAIVRVPWDDQLSGRAPARPDRSLQAPPALAATASGRHRAFDPSQARHWAGVLTPAAAQAYTAVAGVLVSALAQRQEAAASRSGRGEQHGRAAR